eukprot:2841297-Pyramimonas_sp.AAC.1
MAPLTIPHPSSGQGHRRKESEGAEVLEVSRAKGLWFRLRTIARVLGVIVGWPRIEPARSVRVGPQG